MLVGPSTRRAYLPSWVRLRVAKIGGNQGSNGG